MAHSYLSLIMGAPPVTLFNKPDPKVLAKHEFRNQKLIRISTVSPAATNGSTTKSSAKAVKVSRTSGTKSTKTTQSSTAS
ncbi:unnamed protein product [Aureobasidium pullulans]|nr:unnamed protein product [Aureobasidium pullulans]